MANFLIKTEDGKKTYVGVGRDHGEVYAFETVATISDDNFDYVLREVFKTEPRTMYGEKGRETLSLPHQLHRLSGISYEKMETQFTLEYVSVDFETNKVEVKRKWNIHAKQWPDGFVKIEEVEVCYRPDVASVQWVINQLAGLVKDRAKNKKKNRNDEVISAVGMYIKQCFDKLPKEKPMTGYEAWLENPDGPNAA